MSLSINSQSTAKVKVLLQQHAPTTAEYLAKKGRLNKHTVSDALRVLCVNEIAHVKERPIHKDTGRYTNVYAWGAAPKAPTVEPFWWCGNRLR